MTKYRQILAAIVVALVTTLALNSTQLYAAAPWQALTQTIQSHLNPGNQAVGNVSLVQGSTAIMMLHDPRITIGTTLAVKGNNLPGVPLPLQDNIARIRITQLNGNQARGTILNGAQNILSRAPLFPLAHNRVYLYSNLTTPQKLQPYQDLTRALQYNKTPYAVKTGAQITAGDTPGIRPLIIAFEAERNLITCRLTDREQNIFWQNNFALNFAPPITCKAGASWSELTTFNNNQANSIGGNQSFTKATGPAPGTRPAGKIKLKTPYKRLIFADYDQQPGQELVLLNEKWLEVYHLDKLKLSPVARYRLPNKDIIPLHLHAGDFNHNGRDELYLTLGRPTIIDEKNDTFLSSIILEKKGKALKLLGTNYPHYFRVIEQRDGKKVLMVQNMGEFKQYKSPIRWGGFYKGKFEIRKEFRQGRDVFSLYNFNLSPFNQEYILVSDEQGNLAGFNATNSEMLISADSQYGIFDESPYNQKLKEIEYEGGFSITRTAEIRFTARRFVKRNSYGQQIFIIKKRRVVNPSLVEKGIGLVVDEKIKHDQIIGLQWRNGEIRESWKSPKFPRDIVDFGFTKENDEEIMVLLTRNKDGKYALELLH